MRKRTKLTEKQELEAFEYLIREMHGIVVNRIRVDGGELKGKERKVEVFLKDIMRDHVRGVRRMQRFLLRVVKERDQMLDTIVRVGNWCAQDLAENAYVSDTSGNYEKTLHGLCDICRPHMAWASRLKKYGGPYDE
jgi:hypothetical protein